MNLSSPGKQLERFKKGNMRIADHSDFVNAKAVAQKKERGVFCHVCGLEITHGIKNNEFCSKKCAFAYTSGDGGGWEDSFSGARAAVGYQNYLGTL